MANVELSQNEYQKLLDDSAEVRTLSKELNNLRTELENKNKAVEEERGKRKTAQSKREEAEKLLTEKDEEIAKVKEEFGDYETLKENAEKWNTYNEEKTQTIQSKLEELQKELGEEIIEKNSKFIEAMSDEVKIEFLENLRPSKKEDFSNNPGDKTITDEPKINGRLAELQAIKDKGGVQALSGSQKIELLTLTSQSESK